MGKRCAAATADCDTPWQLSGLTMTMKGIHVAQVVAALIRREQSCFIQTAMTSVCPRPAGAALPSLVSEAGAAGGSPSPFS